MSAELGDIHANHHNHDTFGKSVGVLTAVLAVLLSIFTINAHRAHTGTIVYQNSANDSWSRYQAKRIRDYQLEMNMDLLKLVAANNSVMPQMMQDYKTKHIDYSKELTEIKSEAEKKIHESEITEKQAQYFDLAEGILEISLVMSSLYFISRKKLFPVFGALFGLLGLLMGAIGFFI